MILYLKLWWWTLWVRNVVRGIITIKKTHTSKRFLFWRTLWAWCQSSILLKYLSYENFESSDAMLYNIRETPRATTAERIHCGGQKMPQSGCNKTDGNGGVAPDARWRDDLDLFLNLWPRCALDREERRTLHSSGTSIQTKLYFLMNKLHRANFFGNDYFPNMF